MQNLLKFPVILLAALLVASCGDSEKEPSLLDVAVSDAKGFAEFKCKIMEELGELGWEDDKERNNLLERFDEEEEKMSKKYSYNADIPEYVKSAYKDQLKAEERKGCDRRKYFNYVGDDSDD